MGKRRPAVDRSSHLSSAATRFATGSRVPALGATAARSTGDDAPRVATGFDGALAAIEAQRWGAALLAVVAIGLFAYALYSLIEGQYRRLRS